MRTGIALVLMIVAGLAGCTGRENSGSIKLGMVLATSGPYAGGEAPLVNGVKMAVETINASGGINGRNLELITEDTGSQQTGALNAYNRIVSQKPVAIMDTTISAFVMSQMEQIKQAGIPTFTGAGSRDLTAKKNPWLFRIRTSDAWVPVAVAKYATEDLGLKKVGLLKMNDQFGTGWEEGIQGALKAKNQALVDVEFHGSTDKDMAPQLLRLQQSGAELIVVASHPPTHVVILKQRKQLGLDKIPLLASNSAMLPTTLALLDPTEIEGIMGTVDSLPALDPASKEWAAKYKARFNTQADFSAAEYYDGVMMVAEAIKAKGADLKGVADYLHEIKGKKGMGNTWTFGADGDGGSQVVIARVKGGQLEAVKTVVVDR